MRLSTVMLATLALFLTLSGTVAAALGAPVSPNHLPPRARSFALERDRQVRNIMLSRDNNFTPEQVHFLSSTCQVWADSGRQIEARAIMQRVLKSKNADALAHCTMGVTYLNETDDNSELVLGRKYINEAIRLDPNFSQAYFRLAVVEQRSDHFPEALRLLDKALSLKDPYLPSWSTKAVILSSQGRFAEAYKAACQAEKLMPNDYDAVTIKAGVLVQIGKPYEAAMLYKHVYETLHQSDYILHQLINCLAESHHYEEALAELKTLITLTPNDSDTYRLRADIYRKMKNYDAALKDMNRAVDLEPSSTAFKERAKIFELMGKPDKARADLQSAIKISE
jgi:tetratricopeptide (TPR) repeat protein